MAKPPAKPERVYWHERPPGSSTNLIEEYKARGLRSALFLYIAKGALKRNMIPTLKKMSKKLHREENDESFLRILYSHASKRGKFPNKGMAYVFGTWIDRQETMSQLQNYTKGWLPEDAGPILESGEVSGSRGDAVDQYIWILQKRGLRKKMMIKGLIAPSINILVVIAYFIVIAKYIAPGYAQALPRDHWTGPLKIVGFIADIINIYLIPTTAIIALITGGIIWSMKNYTGKHRVMLERMTFFPFWYMHKQGIGSNFMMSYAALTKTTMVENDIIETLLKTAPKYYKSRLEAVRQYTQNGVPIIDALEQCNLEFPDPEIITELLGYKDATDDLPKEIQYLAEQWIEISIERTDAVLKGLDMFITIASYSMVILIMFSDFRFIDLVQDYLKNH